ncbi:MAG: hypothetical protein AAF580_04490 [Pseudomonadota bacterium]
MSTPLSDEEIKRRRKVRSLALAGCLLGLVVLFYILTIVQLSNNV